MRGDAQWASRGGRPVPRTILCVGIFRIQMIVLRSFAMRFTCHAVCSCGEVMALHLDSADLKASAQRSRASGAAQSGATPPPSPFCKRSRCIALH